MAITVKEIREKDFATQKRDGYNTVEVDDFLDAIADQLGAIIKENLALVAQIKELESKPAPQPEVVPVPVAVEAVVEQAAEPSVYDESSYFKNLENVMRETLISSQKTADDTVAEARKNAQDIVAAAQEKANAITASAQAEADAVNKESEMIRKNIDGYRASFRRLVEGQVNILKDADSLFD